MFPAGQATPGRIYRLRFCLVKDGEVFFVGGAEIGDVKDLIGLFREVYRGITLDRISRLKSDNARV